MTARPVGAEGPLRPNQDAMHDFLAHWFHECSAGVVELGSLVPGTKSLSVFARFKLDDLEAAAEYAARINAQPGVSMYFRASTVAETAPPGRTEDQHVVQAAGIWGDHDTADSVQALSNNTLPIKPTCWVVTGTVPYMRVQSFWRLSEPLSDLDMIRDLNRRLISAFQCDPSTYNPSRLMRLPGSIAWPVKAGRSVAELTTWHLGTNRPSALPVHQVTFVLPKVAETLPPQASKSEGPVRLTSALPGTVRWHVEQIRAGDHWHDHMVRLVAHWIGRGWSDLEILTAAAAFTLPGYTAAQTQAEVRKAIEGGRRKWGITDTEPQVSADGPASPFQGDVFDPWDALRPLTFPIDTLPPVLAAFVSSRAKAIGCDPAALAMCALSALSVAIDGRARLRMKRHDTWSVPPALWVALIGPSSARKTPAVNAAWQPLQRRQGARLAAYTSAHAHWKALPKDERGDPPIPPPRYVTHDGTMEALQGILASQDIGLGVIRDELAGFIGAMDKYSGGKGGAADRAFFLQAFDGGAHVVDRVGRGTVAINNLLLTICGGIQPDRLASFGDLTDDGLWQRFIPVVMAPGALGEDVPDGDAEQAYDELVGAVMGYPTIAAQLGEEAMAERQAVERRLFDMEQVEALGGPFTSFLGKLHGIWGRLALVLHAASQSGMAGVVSGVTARNATRLLFDFILPSAARVYIAMGGSTGRGEPTKDIAGYILTKKLERLVASDLTRNIRCARGLGLAEIQKLVSPLVAGGWLAPEKDHQGNNTWLVNPSVHEKFRTRAEREAGRRAAVRALIVEGKGGEE